VNNATLERVSTQYRDGYRAGQAKAMPRDYSNFNPVDAANNCSNVFANFDYANGYKAGANDQWWMQFYRDNGFHAAAEAYHMPGGK
jgi:hypothetical protein